MDTLYAVLVHCLLAISLSVAQTQKGNLAIMTTSPPVSNVTQTTFTSTSSTANTSTTSNGHAQTTSLSSSTTRSNETLDKTTGHPQTSRTTTTTMTPTPTNSTSLTKSTPDSSTFRVSTVPVSKTTAGHTNTSDTTTTISANSTHAVNTTLQWVDKTSQGLGLNISEQNMTIVFGVILGGFIVSMVVFTLYRCKQKIQYVHQPLNNSDDQQDAFEADGDTLVISGGLYDGYPINDNIPTVPGDQSEFHLEFFH